MARPFYKPLDRPENEDIWYCYSVRSKENDNKDTKPAQRIPISQVPDLTKEAPKESTELKELKRKFRRILETDTKYVKLAKTGGRKNLLYYRENERKNTAPKKYQVPEWYYHDDGKDKEVKELSEEEKFKRYKVTYGKKSYKTMIKSKVYERPDYMTHLEPEELRLSLGESDRIPDRPLFGYDSFSIWKRDEMEKSNKLPSLLETDEKKEEGNNGSAKLETQVKRKSKKKVRLPATVKNSPMPGYRSRKLACSAGYPTEWHEKWYVEAVRKS